MDLLEKHYFEVDNRGRVLCRFKKKRRSVQTVEMGKQQERISERSSLGYRGAEWFWGLCNYIQGLSERLWKVE